MTLSLKTPATPVFRVFDSIPPEARLTRRQLAQALTDCGLPISEKTLSTKASRGGGPPYAVFGKTAVYVWESAVAWARTEMGHPTANSAERKNRAAAPAT